MRKVFVTGIILVLMISLLTGCGESDKKEDARDVLTGGMAKYLDTSKLATDKQRISDIETACKVAIADPKVYPEIQSIDQIEITVTKDGMTISPTSGIDEFMKQFKETFSGDVDNYKTSNKNLKIIVKVDNKGSVKSELIDTDTGESLSL